MRSKVMDIAILVTVLVAGFMAGTMHHHNPAPAARPSVVSTFNDGWSDSKQDDCEQGSQYACNWVAQNAPECAHEDGSTQPVCVWNASKHGNAIGHNVLNLDYGKASHNV